MKLFKQVQTYDRFTGKPLDQKETMWTGSYICDYSGVEINAEIDSDSSPYVAFNVVDLHDCEPYFHEDRLRYTKEEALELFDIDWDSDIEIDNYEIFHENNPFVYECHPGKECFRHVLKEMRDARSIRLEEFMLKCRLKMIDRVLRQKLYTPEDLNIKFD